VYLVENTLLPGQRLALKLLHNDAPDPAQWRARFLREVEILSGLSHPNIVTIRHFFEHGKDLGYTMDFVDGVALDTLVRRGPLGAARSVRLAIDVLEALAVAHAKQPAIVHRDMKPPNIVVEAAGTADERARILDFGIAKVLSDAAPALTRGFIGSLHWASPEQCRQLPVDARSDLYSVGCILFQMLTGRLPFAGDSPSALLLHHATTPAPSLEKLAQRGFPPALEAVVARALNKNPDDRYSSAADMVQALRDLERAVKLDDAPSSGCPGRTAGTNWAKESPSHDTETWVQDASQDPTTAAVEALKPAAALQNSGSSLDALSSERTMGPPTGPTADAPAPTEPPAITSGARQVCLRFDQPGLKLTRLFLFAGSRLAYGRNATAPKDADAYVVLRALPCRSEAEDPDNWQRCLRLSSHHGEFLLTDDGVSVTDTSTLGTEVGEKRLARGETHKVPGTHCSLSLADGALDLRCQVFPGNDGRASALVVRRAGNCENHVYVLVRDTVTIGTGFGITVPLDSPAAGGLRAQNVEGRLVIQECLPGTQVVVQGASTRVPYGLAPGATVNFGPVSARVEAVTLNQFVGT
jgi:serine/threonine-protein kinase